MKLLITALTMIFFSFFASGGIFNISDFKKNKENKLKEKNQSQNKTKELKNKYKY